MRDYPPTLNSPTRLWEGGLTPPLKMAEDATCVYIPDGFVPDRRPAAAVAAPQAAQNRFLHQLVVLLLFGALCLAAYFAISRYLITPVIIQGRSMTPTLRDGECYFLNRWAYVFSAPERGDLVVIKDPGHSDFAVKRIIAKPGDWLNLKDGKVYLNGERLNESYLPKGTATTTADSQEKWFQLGHEHYFVMGDNRACSEDSRVYGTIVRGNILGAIRN